MDDQTSDYHALWHCFGCGESGHVIALVEQALNMRFLEALMVVEHHQYAGDPPVKRFYRGIVTLPKFYEAPRHQDDWNPRYLNYLFNRGITWKQIRNHRIGYVDAGKFVNRVIVPVMLNGELKTWVGRSILENVNPDRRVTSAKAGEPGLFGSEMSNPYTDPAFLCEGWADALAIERLGFSNCMAVQTSRLHPDQFKHLELFSYTVVVPDGDESGKKFIDSLAPYIDDHDFAIVELPNGEDPASLAKQNPEELKRLIYDCHEWEPTQEEHQVDVVL